MNERIRQLAEQAGLSEGVFTRHNGVPCDLKGYSMLPDEMQKFAQLIVKECANVAAEHDALDIYEEIREHFGVEERTPSQKMADAGYTRRPKGWTKEGEE